MSSESLRKLLIGQTQSPKGVQRVVNFDTTHGSPVTVKRDTLLKSYLQERNPYTRKGQRNTIKIRDLIDLNSNRAQDNLNTINDTKD